MLVIAKQLGEHPQGRWRHPGEKFEFDGKKPAMWMMTADEAGKAQAEAKAKAEEDAEIIKAQQEAKAKIQAKGKAKTKAPAKDKDKTDEKGIHAFHKGFGKYEVLGADGKVVEGGVDLNKADAGALVDELLLADKAEA